MLTEQQKHEFETFGFLLLKDLIPSDEMQLYIDAFDETMTKANGGVPWQRAPQGHAVSPFYRHNPAVYHGLLDDERITEVVEELLGEDFVFWHAEGHHYWRGTPWHHDSVALEGMTHLKVVFFLDPVRANTGCLSMLPGTHFTPVRDRMERWYGGARGMDGDFAAWPAAIALESDPGDAAIFNIKVYHAALGEDQHRRSININYIQNLRTPEQEEYLKSMYGYDNPPYTPELFEDATPRRMRMLSFLKEACYDAR